MEAAIGVTHPSAALSNSTSGPTERFASANSMTLGFSEKSWSLNMSGSREVTDEFSKCVVRLGQAAPTQPSSKRTQPFGSQAMARHSPTIRATMTAASEGMIR